VVKKIKFNLVFELHQLLENNVWPLLLKVDNIFSNVASKPAMYDQLWSYIAGFDATLLLLTDQLWSVKISNVA